MPLNNVKSEFPCFWFAKYDNIDELSLIKCKNCNKYIKNSIDTISCCENSEIDNNIYKLENNEIYEFDYQGSISIPFRNLPPDNMKFFGIANTIKNELYVIDLNNGRFNINGTIVKPSIYYQKNNLIISDLMQRYGYGGDLIHFKTATAILNRESFIQSYNIGYKCKINNLNIQVLLSISTQDYVPSFYTSFTES